MVKKVSKQTEQRKQAATTYARACRKMAIRFRHVTVVTRNHHTPIRRAGSTPAASVSSPRARPELSKRRLWGVTGPTVYRASPLDRHAGEGEESAGAAGRAAGARPLAWLAGARAGAGARRTAAPRGRAAARPRGRAARPAADQGRSDPRDPGAPPSSGERQRRRGRPDRERGESLDVRAVVGARACRPAVRHRQRRRFPAFALPVRGALVRFASHHLSLPRGVQ